MVDAPCRPSTPPSSSPMLRNNLRALGPGLNPFAPLRHGQLLPLVVSSDPSSPIPISECFRHLPGRFLHRNRFPILSARSLHCPVALDLRLEILLCPAARGATKDTMVQVRRSLSMSRLRSCHDADDRGWNPLHVAARKGDLKEVRRLLDEGMVDVNAPAWGPKCPGATPLHLAAQGGHVKVMDELLERGANIDARTKGACGWTPLHVAAKERNKKAVRFLIENGAFLPSS